jgi:hypothetical protein
VFNVLIMSFATIISLLPEVMNFIQEQTTFVRLCASTVQWMLGNEAVAMITGMIMTNVVMIGYVAITSIIGTGQVLLLEQDEWLAMAMSAIFVRSATAMILGIKIHTCPNKNEQEQRWREV